MANDISSTVRAFQPAPTSNAGQFVELKGSSAAATAAAPKPQALPPAGTDLPQSAPDNAGLEEALTRINDYVQSVQRDLSFSMDDASGKTIISVTNRSTGDLIRQIPSEEVLAMAEYLGSQVDAGGAGSALQGMLLSETT